MEDRSKEKNEEREREVHAIFQICTTQFVKVVYQEDEFRRRKDKWSKAVHSRPSANRQLIFHILMRLAAVIEISISHATRQHVIKARI